MYQRPQHLLSRFAQTGRRVYFVEEPEFLPEGDHQPRLDVSWRGPYLSVVVPRLPAGLSVRAIEAQQRVLLDHYFLCEQIRRHVLWYYTPMALGFSRHLPSPLATVYDCMDELSAFRGAPPELLLREAELFRRADLVLTGGHSLYEAKRGRHPSVHAFPSSVDTAHFASARSPQADPTDQATIPRPRLGFFGVIDERLDIGLLASVADLRPDWHIVLIGPTVKIDAAGLPRRPNIHYLGAKTYAELPAYLAGWDVALIPFARNEATRFISPTKTPEYLAAGKPVVSTSIRDVVQPYGARQLVRIADEPNPFIEAVGDALSEKSAPRIARSDAFLAGMSWDGTWAAIHELVGQTIARKASATDPRSASATAAVR